MNINHQLIFSAKALQCVFALSCAAIVVIALSFFAEWMRLRIRRNRWRRGSGVVDVIFYDPPLLLDDRVFEIGVDHPVVVEVFVRRFDDGTRKAFLRCKPDTRPNGAPVEVDDFEGKRFRATVSVVDRPDVGLVVDVNPQFWVTSVPRKRRSTRKRCSSGRARK